MSALPYVEPRYDPCEYEWWLGMYSFGWYGWYECEWLRSRSRLSRSKGVGASSAGGAMTVAAGVAGALDVGEVLDGVGDERRAGTDMRRSLCPRSGIWMWRGGSGRVSLVGGRKKPSRGEVGRCECWKASALMAGESCGVGREADVCGGVGARERYDWNSLVSSVGRGGARRGRGSLLSTMSRPKRSDVDETDELDELEAEDAIDTDARRWLVATGRGSVMDVAFAATSATVGGRDFDPPNVHLFFPQGRQVRRGEWGSRGM